MLLEYYVYVLSREDGTPFYVGFGKGNRIDQHERFCNCKDRDSHKNRIIRGLKSRGVVVPKEKVLTGLSKADAAKEEIALIRKIGREPLGPLVNQTDGGDGCRNLTQETKARINAATSLRMKGNQYRKGIPHTDEMKAYLVGVLRSAPMHDGSHMMGNTHGCVNRGKPKSPEHRSRIKAAAMLRVAEGRHHVKAGCKLSPEHYAAVAAANKARAKISL